MKKIIKKGGKAVKMAICIIAALVLIFAGLFAAFLISEHKTAPINQTQPNQTSNNSGQPVQNITNNSQNPQIPCSFTLETVADILEPFKWHTLTFKGTKEGNSTTITYGTIFYVKERNGLIGGDFIVNQRNNPRRIENISSNITKMPAKKAYISLDSSVSKCPNTIIASTELSYFMGVLGIEANGAVTGGVSDPSIVKTCANADENTTVFILKKGGCNPGITQEGNCITIDSGKQCYSVEATERAIMDMIEFGMEQGTLKISE